MKILEEKWFKFRRFYFKEGYIDKYMGDQASDPNKDKKPYISLNTPKVWLRLNDGEWEPLDRSYPFSVYIQDEYREYFTAEEVWDGLDMEK